MASETLTFKCLSVKLDILSLMNNYTLSKNLTLNNVIKQMNYYKVVNSFKHHFFVFQVLSLLLVQLCPCSHSCFLLFTITTKGSGTSTIPLASFVVFSYSATVWGKYFALFFLVRCPVKRCPFLHHVHNPVNVLELSYYDSLIQVATKVLKYSIVCTLSGQTK